MSADTTSAQAKPPAIEKLFEWISALAWPVGSFAALLIGWQLLVPIFKIPEYILPVPSDFLSKFWAERALLAEHTLVTAKEILLGFLMATIISIPLGYLIVSIKFLEKALYPIIVFFQLIPKIAIAPLFVVWFGFGLFPKILFTFMLCFFPTLIASMTGFRALDERVLYLTRSMGATAWQTFRYVRVPAALTYIFSGLKVSIAFAATGAVVAEFIGANAGLGYLLLRGSSFLDMPLIFACLTALCIIGIAFSYAVDFIEAALMPWTRNI